MKKAYAVICVTLALALIFLLWGVHHFRNYYRAPLSATPLAVSDTVNPIDINSADMDELCCLPGIGEALAQRIIDYRSNIGGFTSLEQLLQIKGIGQLTLERIKPFLTVGGT